MRRVCFLGNSHLAAVKLGLDLARRQGLLGEVVIETFGARWRSLTDTRIEDGWLVPASEAVARSFAWTSGGQTRLRLDAYETIYLVAGRSPYSLLNYMPAGLLPPPSGPMFRAVARGWTESWAPAFGRQLARALGGGGVVFVGQPEPALDGRRQAWYRALLEEDGRPHPARVGRLREVQAAIRAAVAATPHGFAALPPPPPACLDELGVYTRAEFLRGAVRLTEAMDEAQPETDRIHMNAAYGLALLRHLGLAGG